MSVSAKYARCLATAAQDLYSILQLLVHPSLLTGSRILFWLRGADGVVFKAVWKEGHQ